MPPKIASATQANQSMERTLQVLSVFTAESPTVRVSDVAARCGLGMSTSSRLLVTLVAAGFVQRNPDGSHQLGHRLVALAGTALNSSQVYRESRNIAYAMSCELGLGVNVAELRDGHVFYLLNFDGRHAPRTVTLMGQSYPLHATGLGRCLLLGLDPAERDSVLGPDPFPSYTTRTIIDRRELSAELERISAQGYAVESEEIGFSRACVAAPIRDRTGSVAAAISVSGPLSVLRLGKREPELSQAVIEAADAISTALGAIAHARNTYSHTHKSGDQRNPKEATV